MKGFFFDKMLAPTKGGGKSWSSYWATLISATVENATPTHVVLTFPAVQTSLGKSDFTIAGFSVASASWTGAVLTLVLTTTVYVYHGNLVITFVRTGTTASVTNNVADDTNTVAWYDTQDLSTVTKNAGQETSLLIDKLLSGHDLYQVGAGTYPLWSTLGLLFDGSNDFLYTGAFSTPYEQPEQIYLVIKRITWGAGNYMIDGATASTGGVYDSNATPNIAAYAGLASGNTPMPLDQYVIIRVLFNGLDSKLQVDAATVITGNFSASDMGGITIGRPIGYAGDSSNMQFMEGIFRKVVDDVPTENAIFNYLIAKYEAILDGLSYTPRELIESGAGEHTGGATYTGFGSGVVFKGKEIYVQRCADNHVINTVSHNSLIFYTRSGNTFTTKILDITYDKDFCDPNIVVSKDGNYLILTTCGVTFGGTAWDNYMFILDENLDVLYTYNTIETGYYSWGNVVETPTGKILKTAYKVDATSGVNLYRSSGTTLAAAGSFSNIETLFAAGADQPTECTLSVWGTKLVAIARRNNGTMLYRETSNLEGDDGWSVAAEIINLTNSAAVTAHAPCLEPYVSAGDPLILTVSGWNFTGVREPQIIATMDGVTWTRFIRLATEANNGGGYNSFVNLGSNIYGMMWYEDVDGTPTFVHSNLWYQRINMLNYLPEIV